MLLTAGAPYHTAIDRAPINPLTTAVLFRGRTYSDRKPFVPKTGLNTLTGLTRYCYILVCCGSIFCFMHLYAMRHFIGLSVRFFSGSVYGRVMEPLQRGPSENVTRIPTVACVHIQTKPRRGSLVP